jgi:hypothetical protein
VTKFKASHELSEIATTMREREVWAGRRGDGLQDAQPM